MRPEMLSGHLEFMLLAIVSDQPAHGYAVIQALKDRSRGTFDLAEGTVYPVLHRLEKQGLLASSWTTHDGRRRRTYTTTATGEDVLRTQRKTWRDFARAVSAVTSVR